MKNSTTSTASHALMLSAGTAAETVLQFLFVLIASRQLGPESFGYYGYLIALVTLAGTIVQFGFPVTVVREIAQRPRQEYHIFSAMFRIRIFLSAVFFGIAVIFYALQPIDLEHRITAWIVFLYLVPLPFELTAVFDAKRLWRWDVPGKVIGRLLTIAVLLALWKSDGTLTMLEVAISAAVWQFTYTIVSWIIARKIGLQLYPFDSSSEVGNLLKLSAPVMLANAVTILNTQSQLVYVRWLTTPIQTGYFALEARIVIPLILAKGVLYRILLPHVAEVAQTTEPLKQRLERLLPTMDLLFMPLSCAAIVGVDFLVIPVFGMDYSGAVLPTQIALSEFFLTGTRSMYGAAVLASGDAKPQTIGMVIGCALGLALGFFWIPKYGATGAALSFVAGSIVANYYPWRAFRKICRVHTFSRTLRIAAPCILSLAAYFLLTRFSVLTPVPSAAIFLIALTGGLFAGGELSVQRLRSMQQLFRQNRT